MNKELSIIITIYNIRYGDKSLGEVKALKSFKKITKRFVEILKTITIIC
tara:strand:- start:459 stop:605 length:147 start_codon:yes stop_codon:yes gene_type:complete